MKVMNYGFPIQRCFANSYVLDRENRFVWFSSAWNLDFQPLFQEPYDVLEYVGQNFFDQLSGPSIRLIYRSLFELIRRPESSRLIYTLPCHIFPRKLLLTQELSRHDEDHLVVQFRMRPGEILDMPMPAESEVDSEQPLKMCCQCRAVLDQDMQVWLPIDEALNTLAQFRAPQIPLISHAYCPACLTLIRGKRHEYSGRG